MGRGGGKKSRRASLARRRSTQEKTGCQELTAKTKVTATLRFILVMPHGGTDLTIYLELKWFCDAKCGGVCARPEKAGLELRSPPARTEEGACAGGPGNSRTGFQPRVQRQPQLASQNRVCKGSR